ncbi:MAG: hypothetical protein SX243_04210 [Acidobacteriota bacterium]|nr:hypothetical protein [Acidobacteriota bacterium]
MLTFQGTVDDRGNVPALPVSLNLVATLIGNGVTSVALSGDVETEAGGTFELTLPVPQDELDPFGDSVDLVLVITPYVPGATFSLLILDVVAGAGQPLRQAINQRIDDLAVTVDLSGLSAVALTVTLFDDRVTERFFDDVVSLQCELRRHLLDPVSASLPLAPQAWETRRTSPAYRVGDQYLAQLLVTSDDLDHHHFLRYRSDGEAALGEVAVRLRELATGGLLDERSSVVMRLDERVGVGTISSGLPDREFRFPVVLMDMDLDFVVDGGQGQLRVRCDVGIGTGANLVLFGAGSVDAFVSLAPKNHEGGPFDLLELEELFEITVDSVDHEMTPNTDLDDLPFWVYLALLPFLPGFTVSQMTQAAVTAAIEAIVEAELPGIVVAAIEAELADAVVSALDDRIEEEASAAGLDTDAAQRADLMESLRFWFEMERVEIDADDVRVLGWAGGAGFVSDAILGGTCAVRSGAAASDNEENDGPSRMRAEREFRPYADTFEGYHLQGWLDAWRSFQEELSATARKNPKLYLRAARIAARHRELLAAPREARLSQEGAREIVGFVEEVREAVQGEELRAVLDEVGAVFEKGGGLTVAELAKRAAEARPAPGRSHGLSPARFGKAAIGERRRIVRLADDGEVDVGRVVKADPKAKEPSSEEARAKRRERRRRR